MKKTPKLEDAHGAMLTLTEAAAMLRCHPNTIRAWVRQGKLASVPMGVEKVGMFRKQDVEALRKPLEQAGVIVREDKHAFPVVGIGASAGGLEAVSRLLQHLPTDLGLAYVFISHMEPGQEGILADLLRKKTAMPVMVVENGMRLERDRLYIGPGAMHASIVDGTFVLQTPRGKGEAPRPIDAFFTALANEYQNNAIGVVLSGTGMDGTEGLRSIREEDGLAIAQDGSAQNTDMPDNAQEAGVVDLVLSPEEIGKELSELVRQLYPGGQASIPSKHQNELRRILTYLEEQRGVDFSQYKETTIHRRIIRRMLLSKCRKLSDYSALLHGMPSEVDTLYNDLLINVSSFFRDPLFFTALSEQVFPALFQERMVNEPLRIWVAACAGGEEVVSIAITLLEFLGDHAMTRPVQIFATDLNERTIEKARLGIYKRSALQNVSPARIKQFFTHVDGHFQVIKSIRDMCVFAKHDLLKDPPFSRMDLVSCQNVLIYLENAAQGRILKSFHYALKPTGFLALGRSETPANAGDLFLQHEREHKVYMKKHKGGTRLNMDMKYKPGPIHFPGAPPGPQMAPVAAGGLDLDRDTDKLLLHRYMPAGVVVNKDLDIVRFRGVTAPFLGPNTGKASLNLLKMVRDDLAFELRTLLQKARKEKMTARKNGIPIRLSEGMRDVGLEVVPMGDPRDPHYLVLFKEEGISAMPATAPPDGQKWKNLRDAREKRIILLEQELRDLREQMRIAAEESEASNQELQAANEEVVSSNEELQSMNEELETSKEELQSINEEFATINEELQARNEALRESDERLRLATRTGKVGIWDWDIAADRLTWSDSLYEVHGVRPETFMASMKNFVSLVHAGDRERMQEAIDRSMKFDARFETEFRAVRPDGRVIWLFMNASVIRTSARPVRMLGATLDITDLKATEHSLQQRTHALELLNSVGDTLIAELDTEKIVQAVTDAGREVTGAAFGAFFHNLVNEEGESYTLFTLSGAPREAFAKFPMPRATELFGPTFRGEGVIRIGDVLKDPRYGRMDPHHGMPKGHLPVRSYLAVPVTSRDGRVIGGLFYGHPEPDRFTPASEEVLTTLAAQAALALDNAGLHAALQHELEQQRIAQAALRDREERFRLLADNMDQLAWMAEADGSAFWFNQRWVEFSGIPLEEIRARAAAELHHPDHYARVTASLRASAEKGESWEDTFPMKGRDGEWHWFLSRATPVRDAQGRIHRWFGTSTDVTQQRQAQEKLERSEEHFRELGNSMAQLAWIGDADGVPTWFNEQWRAFTGIDMLQATAEERGAITHPDYTGRVRESHRAGVARGETWEEIFPLLRKDGQYRWFLSRSVPVRDANGTLISWFGTNTDITEHKLAEEAARRLAAIVESSHDAILSKDLNGIVTTWNIGAQRIFGYTAEEIIGRPVTVLFPHDRENEEPAILERIRKGERVEHYETVRKRKDGTLVEVSLSISPIRDHEGKVVGASKIVRDISEQLMMAKAIERSGEQLRMITDRMPVAVVRCSRDLRYIWASQGYLEWIGMPAEAVHGRPILEVLGPQAYATIKPYMDRVLRGERVEYEAELELPLRGTRWINAIYVPVRTEGDESDGWIAVITDITERKGLEAALHDADRHKDHFLATLAHELRSPLAPLKNGLQLMEMAPDEPELQETTRAMMVRQLDHMVRLVDDLMDLSRISRGKIELVKENADLADIIATAMETSRPLVERNGHHLQVNMANGPTIIHGDPTRLTQVVANLLNNAAKYTPPGGRIRLDVEREKGNAVIRVKDNGIGIDPAALPHVFDMFAQVDPAQKTHAGGGLGIGLNVVQRLVRMHKGEVEGHSDGPGKGSEFVVRLPLADSPAPAKVVARPRAEQDGEKKRVLVVDDNQDAAVSMSQILIKRGHEVQVAHDGEQALQLGEKFRPDVVLMDIGMPKMNGYDACTRMRGTPWGKGIHIIALSGWGQEEDRKRSTDAGFDVHLVKPIDGATLRRMISELPPRSAD